MPETKPDPKPADDAPKFGRLLLVLLAAVLLIGVLTFVMEALYTP